MTSVESLISRLICRFVLMFHPRITVREWLRIAPIASGGWGPVRYPALLGNGRSVSIQASEGHNSDPKTFGGPHKTVEIMTSSAPRSWSKYEDGTGSCVYAHLPVEKLQRWVDRNGGIRVAPSHLRRAIASKANDAWD